ncbi:MAG: hypothetical protein EXR72_24275 [Myxococcales bacterium]|nr:hypothetical protein [Myxococcales bacterium]
MMVPRKAAEFFGGSRRGVVIPPEKATAVHVSARSLSGGALISTGAVDVLISGHSPIEQTLALGSCGGSRSRGDLVARLAPLQPRGTQT